MVQSILSKLSAVGGVGEQTSLEEEGYRCLGFAIVAQAVEDWKTAKAGISSGERSIKKIRSSMHNENLDQVEVDSLISKTEVIEHKIRTHRSTVTDCERFFKSQWFSCVTEDADGEIVLEMLKKMNPEEKHKKSMKRFLNQEAAE